MTTLTHTDIADRIPHRFENILLDECTIVDDTTCNFSLTIQSKDILGRELFAISHTHLSIPTPILTEISALASIIGSGTIEPGTFAYFAAITNFSCNHHPFLLNQNITGTTKQASSKNGFFKYAFNISSGQSEATGQLMAYYDKNMTTTDTELPPIELDPAILKALTSPGTPIQAFNHKHRSMTFIDSSLALPSEYGLIYSYQYPVTHPLIQGHFPGNPVMMGVCQWQMLEDAIYHYAQTIAHPLPTSITCSALIFKKDLTPVCEIKQAVISVNSFDKNCFIHTESVKKILFKQRVSPADQLFIHITLN